MLSGETAVGEYPVEAVADDGRIARAVEPSLGYRHQLPEADRGADVGHAMSNAACDLAEALARRRCSSRPSPGGRRRRSRACGRAGRSSALTHHQYALQQMALEWGVTPLSIPESPDVEELWELLDRRGPRRAASSSAATAS